MSRRQKCAALLRPWLERCGIDRLSWPALNGLDRKLARHLRSRDGWFVEAGANDGFQQSNTYHLARFQGWRGVLIEPVPWLAEICGKTRPESQVHACALGPPDRSGSKAQLRYAGLMTGVCGAWGDEDSEKKRAKNGLEIQGLPTQELVFDVPVRTLTEVLAESGVPAEFDLLSLDVEGYELEVLKGLDLERHRPRFICIETRPDRLATVLSQLRSEYILTETLHASTPLSDYLLERCPQPPARHA